MIIIYNEGVIGMRIIAAFIAFVMSLLAWLVYIIAFFGIIFIVLAFFLGIWPAALAGFCMLLFAFVYFLIMEALSGY